MNPETTVTTEELRAFASLPTAPPTRPGEVSEVARERIRRQEAEAREAGFALPPPIYAAGTRVIDLGDENFVTERQCVEALPTFAEAAERVTGYVESENRRDEIWPLHDTRMAGDGTVFLDQNPEQRMALEPRAFSALCQRGGFGRGAAYLRDNCPVNLRAFNLNAQFLALDPNQDRRAMMRVRGPESSPAVYGVVSPRYTPYDVDQFLADAVPALADTRSEIVYDPDTSSVRADAFWMPDRVVDLAAGDVFKAGVRLRTADDGSGSLRIQALLFRNLCLNLIVIGEATVDVLRARHVGDAERIRTRVREGVEEARTRVGAFLEAWGHARTLKADFQALLPDLALRAVELGAPRSQTADLEKAMALAYAREPGDTMADVSNAVTRAAHESPFPQRTREILEALGSEVVVRKKIQIT